MPLQALGLALTEGVWSDHTQSFSQPQQSLEEIHPEPQQIALRVEQGSGVVQSFCASASDDAATNDTGPATPGDEQSSPEIRVVRSPGQPLRMQMCQPSAQASSAVGHAPRLFPQAVPVRVARRLCVSHAA